jgi:hypothetical protein
MNPESTPSKTPKGIAELETRALQLSPKLRQALVRVDGAKSFAELVSEAGAMGEALRKQLLELLAQGFITDAPDAARPAAGIAQPAMPRPAAKLPDGLSATQPLVPDPLLQRVTELKASIRWLLADAMEGKASPMDLQLNHCRTIADLDKLVDEAFMPIQSIAGKPRAAHFWREAKALLLRPQA